MTIPSELYSAFTMNGTIPVVSQSVQTAPSTPAAYSQKQIQELIGMARSKRPFGPTDPHVYQAIEKYIDTIKEKQVAVFDSSKPWYESILLSYNAHPTSINAQFTTDDPRIAFASHLEGAFDAILSISHLKSAGLSHPLNPNADIEAMAQMKLHLKKDGLLLLAVPVGKNCLVWNSHRIYGESRLKVLLKGWRILSYHGFTFEDLLKDGSLNHQPIIALRPL